MKAAKELNSKSTVEFDIKLWNKFEDKNAHWRNHNPARYKVLGLRYIKDNQPKAGKMLDGHYGLPTDSTIGKDYINDLSWCLNFALENRKEMMLRVVAIIRMVLDKPLYKADWDTFINRNHNHAEMREDGLWYHRKGATQAEEGMMGVIPGNMRDGSFIVKGKGNPDSLYSSSHGAGRVLGRKEAKRKLNVEEFKNTMKGIKGKIDADTLDEAPDAYKDIFEVMELQKDLVEVIAHIKPLINIKG